MQPPSTPLRSSLRHKVLFGFGLALVLLSVVPLVVLHTHRGLHRWAVAVDRSRKILDAGQRVQRLLISAENEWRALVFGKDAGAQERFDEARSLSREALGVMEEEAGEDAARLGIVLELEKGVLEHFAQLSADMGADEPLVGKEAAERQKAVLARRKELVKGLGEYAREERARLVEQEKAAQATSRYTVTAITVGTVLTLAVLVGAARLILRDIAARRRAEDALADQHTLLSSILETIPDSLFVKDLKGRYVLGNRAHRRFLQLEDSETVEGRSVHDFFASEHAEAYERADREVLSTGKALMNHEERAVTRKGVEVWLSTTKVPLLDRRGRTLGLVCVSSDVTERRQAEDQLRHFAAQLERSNAELQHFASVASHDLQEPLRKVQAFADRLRSKCGEQLGEAGLDYLGRMENAAERMRVLIQDLLKLSRVTSRAQPFERCDLALVLREVLADLEVAVERNGAVVDAGPLPEIDADPLQMRQLFQNLVANALKFHAAGRAPRVTVSAKILEASEHGLQGVGFATRACRLEFRDNGIGFDPKFAEQIFVVFQRLHSRSEYEGTGIGLALCRRIAERHLGVVTASAVPGEGAVFVVTLPMEQPMVAGAEAGAGGVGGARVE